MERSKVDKKLNVARLGELKTLFEPFVGTTKEAEAGEVLQALPEYNKEKGHPSFPLPNGGQWSAATADVVPGMVAALLKTEKPARYKADRVPKGKYVRGGGYCLSRMAARMDYPTWLETIERIKGQAVQLQTSRYKTTSRYWKDPRNIAGEYDYTHQQAYERHREIGLHAIWWQNFIRGHRGNEVLWFPLIRPLDSEWGSLPAFHKVFDTLTVTDFDAFMALLMGNENGEHDNARVWDAGDSLRIPYREITEQHSVYKEGNHNHYVEPSKGAKVVSTLSYRAWKYRQSREYKDIMLVLDRHMYLEGREPLRTLNDARRAKLKEGTHGT